MAKQHSTSSLFDGGSENAPHPEKWNREVVNVTQNLLVVLQCAIDQRLLGREEVAEVLRRVWYEIFQK